MTAGHRQPIFRVPASVLSVVGVLVAVQALIAVLPDEIAVRGFGWLAFVPARWTAAFDPAPVARRLAGLHAADPSGEGPFAAARFFLGSGSAQPWTSLTYAVLHGGWTHVGLNAVWLLAFGTPVQRRIGSARFLALLAAGAMAGAAVHYLTDPLSLQPLVGASAAVSACMGAALRFMFRRPVDDGDPAAEPSAASQLRAERSSLLAIARDRRAAGFLAVWFLSNFITGVAAIPLGLSDMPVAWQAHIGGFLLGLLAFPLFDRAADARPPHEGPLIGQDPRSPA